MAAPIEPPSNPFLAREFNNQSHWNDAATDSTAIAVPRGHYRVTPDSYEWVPGEALGIPHYSALVAGREVHWFFAGTTLRKFVREQGTLREVDRRSVAHRLPDYVMPTDDLRRQQAEDLRALIAARDEQAVVDYLDRQPNRLSSAVEDQVAHGVLYSLITADHAFIGANARGLLRIDQGDPTDPVSPLREPLQVTLPDSLFDDAKVRERTIFQTDSVFGLGMTFNGFLVINTVGGKIATLDRRSLRLIDVYRTPETEEVFSNSFATSREAKGGAVYVASNRKMYRLVVDARGRIHSDAGAGAWSARYDAGERLPVGKIADGTGATPTLMGFGRGEDELVVLTDGRRKMRLVAFWRNAIPKQRRSQPGVDPRIADQLEVDMGPELATVQSEQSVVTYGSYAFVLNAVPDKSAPPIKARGSYARGLLTGLTRPLPRGVAMLRWNADQDRWQALWQRSDVGTVATVPMISGGSRMVIVNGGFVARPGELYHLGFDLDRGELVMSIASGADPLFNGAFTGIKCDRGGALMYTTVLGLLRFDVGRMQTVDSPDPLLRASTDTR
ncbi:MAG: hypothetical protein RLZZ372_1963 [Pseudomonadota bacterium]|jgi:hypothetical protein